MAEREEAAVVAAKAPRKPKARVMPTAKVRLRVSGKAMVTENPAGMLKVSALWREAAEPWPMAEA